MSVRELNARGLSKLSSLPKPIVSAIAGIIVFTVIFKLAVGEGVDPTFALVVAAAAAFGSFYVTIKLPF
jgi:hypothetical protein